LASDVLNALPKARLEMLGLNTAPLSFASGGFGAFGGAGGAGGAGGLGGLGGSGGI